MDLTNTALANIQRKSEAIKLVQELRNKTNSETAVEQTPNDMDLENEGIHEPAISAMNLHPEVPDMDNVENKFTYYSFDNRRPTSMQLKRNKKGFRIK